MQRQRATLRARTSGIRIDATLEMTPRGLAVVGACVSVILLGSAAIVVAARINPR